jgi:hypothetical protein
MSSAVTSGLYLNKDTYCVPINAFATHFARVNPDCSLVIMGIPQNKMLARYLYHTASVWTYSFDENIEITEDNLSEYVSYSVYNSNDFSKQDLLKAVKWLYDGKFNKR